MSDRSTVTFQIHRHSPDKGAELESYLDDTYQPEELESTPSYIEGYIEELTLGSAEEMAAGLVEIDPSIVFAVWQSPKYEYPGVVCMHHPEVGMFQGTCLDGGAVVLTWEELVGATPEGTAKLFGRPWLDRIEAMQANVPPTCILTGAEGENADDCTTHDHEVRDVSERVLTYDRNGEPHDEVMRTKSGKVITQADIQRWADEAERGYDIKLGEPILNVIVTRSAGADGALLVFLDTTEQTGPIRVNVNDDEVYAEVALDALPGVDLEARDVNMYVYESDVAYITEPANGLSQPQRMLATYFQQVGDGLSQRIAALWPHLTDAERREVGAQTREDVMRNLLDRLEGLAEDRRLIRKYNDDEEG